ncbi:MAG: DUF4091 domain-containing protein [Armatimonadota bacterium]
MLLREAPDPEPIDPAAWNRVSPGLHAGFGSLDDAESRSVPPPGLPRDGVGLTGWRGERVACKLLAWTADPIGTVRIRVTDLVSGAHAIPRDRISPRVVGYVLTDEFAGGIERPIKGRIPPHLKPDRLVPARAFVLPRRETRPIWVSIDIPPETPAGTYHGAIELESGRFRRSHAVVLTVQDRVLPPPAAWRFHLDLWQNPFAVARFHRVRVWSDQHIALLRPLLRTLAAAGQKCITTTLIDKPWGDQVFDSHGSMVRTIRTAGGAWRYDYSVFDRYVALALECGISEQINAYSMVPVGNRVSWFEERSGRTQSQVLVPGSPEHADFWRPFLRDFRAHLRKRGWLERTCIALDEREPEEMRATLDLLADAAPELRVAMAGFFPRELEPSIHDFSSNWRTVHEVAGGVANTRRRAGKRTTFYVACMIPKPNNFTFSPPAESCVQGWFAAAMGLDGFLRWAFNSWPEDPETDSRYITWPSGDTFLIYPGACASIRFERLREGIQDFEKIRLLRAEHDSGRSPGLADRFVALESFLKTITPDILARRSAADLLAEGKRHVHELVGPNPPG